MKRFTRIFRVTRDLENHKSSYDLIYIFIKAQHNLIHSCIMNELQPKELRIPDSNINIDHRLCSQVSVH